MAPYDEDKLKFWRSDIVPKPVVDIAPDVVARAFRDPDVYIRKPDDVYLRDTSDSAPITPYWDTLLARDSAARARFVRRLAQRGLVGFRRRIRSRIGIASRPAIYSSAIFA